MKYILGLILIFFMCFLCGCDISEEDVGNFVDYCSDKNGSPLIIRDADKVIDMKCNDKI